MVKTFTLLMTVDFDSRLKLDANWLEQHITHALESGLVGDPVASASVTVLNGDRLACGVAPAARRMHRELSE